MSLPGPVLTLPSAACHSGEVEASDAVSLSTDLGFHALSFLQSRIQSKGSV